jgi:DNA-binding beta-propeller fold protein YncE
MRRAGTALRGLLTSAALAAGTIAGVASPLMVVGLDTKFTIDDAGTKLFHPNGGDAVLVYGLDDPAHPALLGSLPLENSIVGPPTNLGVTPDGRLALVANSVHTVQNPDGTWKAVPADDLYVIDTAARPPKLVNVVKVGLQPSGLSINRDGTLALVANREGKSLSLLGIQGQDVRVLDTLPMNDTVTSAAFTPDGKRALVSKFAVHKIAVVSVADGHLKPDGPDMPIGLYPYTVTVTADGRWGLAGATGNMATSDGNLDPVVVIDLAATPPRTVDYVTAGDSIEGLVASPRGGTAVASILQGSYDGPKNAWFHHATGKVTLLATGPDGVKVLGSTAVGAFPEGIAYSPDGTYVYAGNFASNAISVLRLEGERLVDTHADIALPGPPAALRVGSQ